MVRRYRSGWWLEVKYWDEGWTQAEIAEECGVSPQCIRTWMEKRGVETRELAGENHPQYGSERDEATRAKISETMAGREFSAETIERFREAKQGSEIPAETREKISESLSGLERSDETRERMSAARSGAQNPQWNGGVSDSYGVGWGKARECVRERDDVCQHCGREGNERRLDAHHIIPFRLFEQTDKTPDREGTRTREPRSPLSPVPPESRAR